MSHQQTITEQKTKYIDPTDPETRTNFSKSFFLADHENRGLKKSYSNVFEIFAVFPRIRRFLRFLRNKMEGTQFLAI